MSFGNRSIPFAILGVLLALASCRNLALDPVFYTLSKEQPTSDNRGFPDGASVFKIVKFTSTTPPLLDYYLAAAGQLYLRGTGTTDSWTVVAPPAGLANAMCNSLEVFGTQIYAGFFDSANGAGSGLYTSNLSVPLSWTLTTDTNAQGVQIIFLKAVGGQLFVGTKSGTVNALYYGNGGSSTAVTWSTAPASDIAFLDAARASFGAGSFWILVGAYLYQSATIGGNFALYSGGANSPVSPLSGPPASGGLLDDGTALYVGAGNGLLYRTADAGATWTNSGTSPIRDDSGNAVHFTSFLSLFGAGSDAGAVYAGTMGQGYYRIPSGDVTGLSGTLTREPTTYSITDLYNGALNFLFYDGSVSPANLFLCTNHSGLWRGDYASGSLWTWKQE